MYDGVSSPQRQPIAIASVESTNILCCPFFGIFTSSYYKGKKAKDDDWWEWLNGHKLGWLHDDWRAKERHAQIEHKWTAWNALGAISWSQSHTWTQWCTAAFSSSRPLLSLLLLPQVLSMFSAATDRGIHGSSIIWVGGNGTRALCPGQENLPTQVSIISGLTQKCVYRISRVFHFS